MRNPSMMYIKLINGKEFEVVIKKFAQFSCFLKKFEQRSSYDVFRGKAAAEN